MVPPPIQPERARASGAVPAKIMHLREVNLVVFGTADILRIFSSDIVSAPTAFAPQYWIPLKLKRLTSPQVPTPLQKVGVRNGLLSA
jgi:hypothetical protein